MAVRPFSSLHRPLRHAPGRGQSLTKSQPHDVRGRSSRPNDKKKTRTAEAVSGARVSSRFDVQRARVLHHATELSGVAPTGPIPPYVSALDDDQLRQLEPVACALRKQEA